MVAGTAAAVLATALAVTPAATTVVDGADRDSQVRARGVFVPPGGPTVPKAVTYDEASVPAGSSIAVAQRTKGDRMSVEVRLRGIEPDRSFGAHVHTKPCGAKPDDSGPHYQDEVDPVQPSVDPEYANPRNEVWLDFDTDADGNGGAVARLKWTFREGEARSVVVHEHPTLTDPGEAGMAGERLACFTVPFQGGGSDRRGG